jgi:hypothetical protein
MNKILEQIVAMSCILPAIIGLYYFRIIDKKFHAFIYMMILDVVVESIAFIVLQMPSFNNSQFLVINLYMVINFILFLLLVYQNGYISKKSMQLFLILSIPILIFNAISNESIFKTFFYFLCYVSAVMLFISIHILSKQILEVNKKMKDNCWFWISAFSVLYNAFTLLIFGLFFFSLFNSPDAKTIFVIHHYVNATCYIFFAVAIFKIPHKKVQLNKMAYV